MNRILLLFVFLLCSGILPAQDGNTMVHVEMVNVGRDWGHNADIQGVKYVLKPYGISGMKLDADSSVLILQFNREVPGKSAEYVQNDWKVMALDLSDGRVCWVKNIVYRNDDGTLIRRGKHLIYSERGKNYFWDIQTGTVFPETTQLEFYGFPDSKGMNMALGYNPTRVSMRRKLSPALYGLDLDTRTILWKRNINRDYGWNDIVMMDDSTVLVAAAGLHKVDLRTGEGWDYEVQTGGYGAKSIVATALLGMVGMYNSVNTTSGMASNILISERTIYYASKKVLTALDFDGNVKWEADLPGDKSGMAGIFELGGLVGVVNRGVVVSGETEVLFNQPFFAAFQQENGEMVFCNQIGEKKKDCIRFIRFGLYSVLLVGNDRLIAYSLGGKELYSLPVDDIVVQMPRWDKYYVRDPDGMYFSPVESADGAWCPITSQGRLLVLSEKLEVLREYAVDSLFRRVDGDEELTVLESGEKTFVIDENGALKAEIDLKGGVRIGTDYYFRTDGGVIRLVLRSLLN